MRGRRGRCWRRRAQECAAKEKSGQETKEESKSAQEEPKSPRPTAHFVRDVNLPDGALVVPGNTLIKSWEFINPSAASWPEGSKLIFTQGNRELLGDVEEFTSPLATPGQKVEVSCPIQVPSKSGRYQATFQLHDKDRIPFDGHRCWVELVVAEDEKKSPLPQAVETPTVAPVVAAPAPVEAPKAPVVVEAPKAPVVVEAPKAPVAAPKAPVEPKAEDIEAPKEIKVKVDAPKEIKAKVDDVDAALKEKYLVQLSTLEKMGFSNLQLNLYLIHKYKGNIEQTVTWLIEMEKSH